MTAGASTPDDVIQDVVDWLALPRVWKRQPEGEASQMTSKRPRPTQRTSSVREAVDATRQAIREMDSDGDDLDVDPASGFFNIRRAAADDRLADEQEFQTASALAEFVWTATFFDATSQAAMLEEFIDGAQVPRP